MMESLERRKRLESQVKPKRGRPQEPPPPEGLLDAAVRIHLENSVSFDSLSKFISFQDGSHGVRPLPVDKMKGHLRSLRAKGRIKVRIHGRHTEETLPAEKRGVEAPKLSEFLGCKVIVAPAWGEVESAIDCAANVVAHQLDCALDEAEERTPKKSRIGLGLQPGKFAISVAARLAHKVRDRIRLTPLILTREAPGTFRRADSPTVLAVAGARLGAFLPGRKDRNRIWWKGIEDAEGDKHDLDAFRIRPKEMLREFYSEFDENPDDWVALCEPDVVFGVISTVNKRAFTVQIYPPERSGHEHVPSHPRILGGQASARSRCYVCGQIAGHLITAAGVDLVGPACRDEEYAVHQHDSETDRDAIDPTKTCFHTADLTADIVIGGKRYWLRRRPLAPLTAFTKRSKDRRRIVAVCEDLFAAPGGQRDKIAKQLASLHVALKHFADVAVVSPNVATELEKIEAAGL
jgi:hypothetical protein